MSLNPLILLARPARLERATYGFEVRCSIQLSYGRVGETVGRSFTAAETKRQDHGRSFGHGPGGIEKKWGG